LFAVGSLGVFVDKSFCEAWSKRRANEMTMNQALLSLETRIQLANLGFTLDELEDKFAPQGELGFLSAQASRDELKTKFLK
jgi:hypothetical protein